jgi:hypothetical protein
MSERDIELLKRLLADPYQIPQPFKTWLIGFLEMSDMNLPISAISGLKGQLAAIGQATAGKTTIGGRGPFTTDASGRVNLSFPTAYSAVDSIVVSSHAGAGTSPPASNNATCSFNVTAVYLNGFEITVWDVNLNAPFASKPVSLSWIALITP